MYNPKMSPSNDRAFTDHYLLPDGKHYDMLAETEHEIKFLKDHLEYIVISDREIADLRESSKNALTFGNALAILLKKHEKDYKGLTNDSGEEYDAEEDVAEVKKVIHNALYSVDECQTYYFLKTVG